MSHCPLRKAEKAIRSAVGGDWAWAGAATRSRLHQMITENRVLFVKRSELDIGPEFMIKPVSRLFDLGQQLVKEIAE